MTKTEKQSRRQKQKIDSNRTKFYEDRIVHDIKRVKQRYGIIFVKEDIANIRKIVKDGTKGRLKNCNIVFLEKKNDVLIYLVPYKHKFYRVVWNTKLFQITTFLPLYEQISYCQNKNKDYTFIERTNEKIKDVIDRYYSKTIIELTDEDLEFIGT